MREVDVYYQNVRAGRLTEKSPTDYTFEYADNYYLDKSLPAISLSLPKTRREYSSHYLFPFFTNMLTEGANKKVQCRLLRLDENDYFGRLMATADMDVIGCVTVKRV